MTRHLTIICAAVAAATTPPTATAQDDERDALTEILVWGRATDLVGAADSASEGLVGFDDITTRPLLRVGELVEVIPGMIATQHSGGGKANQYFLRGINLDHGTDFSLHFDGMPVNMRTHAHGQGYLDMNFIIPELVKTIEYRKGAYVGDVGDFSSAGSSRFETYDRLDQGFAELTYGTENYLRAVAANSWDVAGGTWLLGGELRRSDGPWEVPEDVELFNGFAKFTTEIRERDTEFIATYYTNDWTATDQIPQRAVDDGSLGRFGSVDPTVGGETYRFNLIANLADENTRYNAFFSSYSLNLFGNPTYWLNDPVNGDQIEQEDGRWIAGGRVDHVREVDWRERGVTLQFGADLRYDDIGTLNLFRTDDRQRLSTVRSDEVTELSVGAYAQAEIHWTDKLRTTLALRGDLFSWDVEAQRPENSGSGSDSIIKPKLGIAYAPNEQWELYLSYGGGFHSNDVRAAELSVDPETGAPAESFDAIVEAEGAEAGFRAQLSDTFNFSATFFYLELDSELIFVGDAGTTEPNDATERQGVEAAMFWNPVDWLVLDATVAKTDARFRDAPAGQDRIPDANDFVAAFGATLSFDNQLVSSLRVRHFGDAPLVEDNSARKGATTLVNLRVSYPLGDFQLGLDVLNLFDAEDSDIEYFYESRLFSEPAPVEDFHFHPVESREIRFSVRYGF